MSYPRFVNKTPKDIWTKRLKKINKPPGGHRKYAEIQHGSCCSLLKPKIPKYRKPNERNAKESSIAMNFYSSRGELRKLYKGNKNFKIFHTCFAACMLIRHAKEKAGVFADHFAVNLTPVA